MFIAWTESPLHL